MLCSISSTGAGITSAGSFSPRGEGIRYSLPFSLIAIDVECHFFFSRAETFHRFTPVLAHTKTNANSVPLSDAFALIAERSELRANLDMKEKDDPNVKTPAVKLLALLHPNTLQKFGYGMAVCLLLTLVIFIACMVKSGSYIFKSCRCFRR